MTYLMGFLVICIGFLFLWKTEWIYQNFGAIDWAESTLSGGTRQFWKIVGLGLIIVAFLFMLGVVQWILLKIFVPGSRNL